MSNESPTKRFQMRVKWQRRANWGSRLLNGVYSTQLRRRRWLVARQTPPATISMNRGTFIDNGLKSLGLDCFPKQSLQQKGVWSYWNPKQRCCLHVLGPVSPCYGRPVAGDYFFSKLPYSLAESQHRPNALCCWPHLRSSFNKTVLCTKSSFPLNDIHRIYQAWPKLLKRND